MTKIALHSATCFPRSDSLHLLERTDGLKELKEKFFFIFFFF